MDAPADLPQWPPGTVCILATGGDGPHAIPVSTAVRASEQRVVLALGARRGSLQRLREDSRVALTVLAAGDVAFTAHGTARVVADPLPGLDGVVGVEISVERVSSHKRPTFSIADGVAWGWADDEARERDAAVRSALLEL
ncbi:MAG: pyridoxamine 5'-phosphate oxidase family protein [Actinomycetes bacterium]